MSKLFYPKLAATNLRKNAQTYIPYIITCVGSVAMFYIMAALARDPGLQKMEGGGELGMILNLGVWVIGIFSVVFLFYTNSFLMKRRKKEFGLFNILGMEKKHIARVIFFETLYTAAISLIAGILAGMLLARLIWLVLLRLLHLTAGFTMTFSPAAALVTLALFGAIFLLTLANALGQIHLAQPVELLRGGQVGEREPKAKWPLAALGVLALGAGYGIAQTVASPIQALNLFFIAVILVIVGTYCLFTAGSIALLKLLRKNRRYYYQTSHFTAVSGLMYRMKQNAVGLANICILSTMALVMLAVTISMYAGLDDALRTRFPRNVEISAEGYSQTENAAIRAQAEQTLAAAGIGAQNPLEYRCLSVMAQRAGDGFQPAAEGMKWQDTVSLSVFSLEDYNRLTGQSLKLGDGEALLYVNLAQYSGDSLSLFGTKYRIARKLDSFLGKNVISTDISESYYVVVKDLDSLAREAGTGKYVSMEYYFGFDVNAQDEQVITLHRQLADGLAQRYPETSVASAAEARASYYTLFGGLFFISLFLGALFIMATVLIIYYKQISEGYEDQQRFEIMQKVGMSRGEVRKSIRSQVLLMFFLPLGTAAVHVAFAFKMITKLLAAIYLTNVGLFGCCTVIVLLVFAVFYAVVYAATARVYYKMIGA